MASITCPECGKDDGWTVISLATAYSPVEKITQDSDGKIIVFYNGSTTYGDDIETEALRCMHCQWETKGKEGEWSDLFPKLDLDALLALRKKLNPS